MTPDPSSNAALGALLIAAGGGIGVAFRAIWKRLERHEARTEKRLDSQESEIKSLRAEQAATRSKYDRLVGFTQLVRSCSVAGCPHRHTFTPPEGERIPRMTPLIRTPCP